MTKGSLKIHSENILPIIKKWLYSDKDIFVRELISNANDAIHKLKILHDRGEASIGEEPFRIDVSLNKENKTLTFSDNGIGMNAEEVEKYIAQIAFSGAEDFVEKYQTKKEGEAFIGHFGLGFYSSYMVSDKVEINTLSYKEGAKPVHWSCDGSPEYHLEEGKREKRGTDIILHISEEDNDFLEESHVKQILEKYCRFLPHPIYLNGSMINEKEPLWIKSPADCTDQDYIDFYRHLYPFSQEPLFWVHLNVDYPFHLKGILYFPKLQKGMDLNKSTIQLYCNRVFVADNCKDIVPEFLMPLHGVIDSPDIPLNVSRSYLQIDRTVRQLSGHISKKVADSLVNLYNNEKEKFLAGWEDISVVAKIGSIENEKFYQRVKPCLVWKSTQGEWITAEAYLEKNKEKTGDAIFYTSDESHQHHLLDLYKKQGIEVLIAGHPVDSYLVSFLERHLSPAKFKRIDSGHDHMIDKEREKTVLDADGRTEAAKLADLIRSQLEVENLEVEAKSLSADHLPGILTTNEEERRMQETMRTISPQQNALPDAKKAFIVNTNNTLINALPKVHREDPELAKELVQEVYDLALLSQREMRGDQLNRFIIRSNELLSKLIRR